MSPSGPGVSSSASAEAGAVSDSTAAGDAGSFADLGLAPGLLEAVEQAGYAAPTKVQAACIPVLLAGRDVSGQAQTGTGKTAAFALPILQRLAQEGSGGDGPVRGKAAERVPVRALVLAPTRELAIQVAEAFESYGRHTGGLRVATVYGGQPIDRQIRALKRGAQVVVGTPGRVMDHIRRGTLDLAGVRTVVLDEADEMLRMGFLEDVEWILERTPEERQTVLFSATMPGPVRKTARECLRDPVEVRIREKTETVAATRQLYWKVEGTSKLSALSRILASEEYDAVLVFVRTKQATLRLAEQLEERGISCAALNGDLGQSVRESILERLRNRRIDVVVATDVAARGLDVDHITHVINYDMPMDVEAYVHRIGRTGRAGREGRAILFMKPSERAMLRAIERTTKQPIERMPLPTSASITQSRIESFKRRIVETIEGEDLTFFRELIDELRTEQAVPTGEAAAALAYLAQRDRPLRGPRDAKRAGPGPAGAGRPTAGRATAGRAAAPSPERVSKSSKSPTPPSRATSRAPRDARPEDAALERSDRRAEPPTDLPAPEPGLLRYRFEVGRTHGARPQDIADTIVEESGLEPEFVGRIDLRETHGFIDLPGGMPRDIYRDLQQALVGDRELRLRRLDDPRRAGSDSRRKSRDPRAQERRGPKGDRPAPGRPKGGKPPTGRPKGGKPPTGRPKSGRAAAGQARPKGGKPPVGRPKGGKPQASSRSKVGKPKPKPKPRPRQPRRTR